MTSGCIFTDGTMLKLVDGFVFESRISVQARKNGYPSLDDFLSTTESPEFFKKAFGDERDFEGWWLSHGTRNPWDESVWGGTMNKWCGHGDSI